MIYLLLYLFISWGFYQTLKFNGGHLPNPGCILISVCFYMFILGISAEINTAVCNDMEYYNALS